MEFKPFPKMARLSRDIWVSEKLDGTNAQVCIVPIPTVCDGQGVSVEGALGIFEGNVVFAGSRTRWLQPGKQTDNYGFAAWVLTNVKELLKLGPGHHFGEFWGAGIQRNYGIAEKRFSLFNVPRWANPEMIETLPACCSVVPVLYRGIFSEFAITTALNDLRDGGSKAAPGFLNPEGIVIYHVAAGIGFKKTFDGDAAKGPAAQSPS